jgi:hypothetical protein
VSFLLRLPVYLRTDDQLILFTPVQPTIQRSQHASVNLNFIAKMAMINILDFPSEVLVKICDILEFKDLCSLELASQHIRDLFLV